jgi:hypothetical protein
MSLFQLLSQYSALSLVERYSERVQIHMSNTIIHNTSLSQLLQYKYPNLSQLLQYMYPNLSQSHQYTYLNQNQSLQ